MAPMPVAGVQPPLESWPRISGGGVRLAEPSLSLIIQMAADAFGVTPRDLRSDRRDRRVVVARHAAMWLARLMTGHSLPAIGRAFGDRDHTTVLYAVSRNGQRMAEDAAVADRVLVLQAALAAPDEAAPDEAANEEDKHVG
jgi:chromosomal replication initiator protein